MAYDAFISYSHLSDGVVAPALEHGLERLARPWYRLRALQAFRDQSDLPLTPSLWGTISDALDDARFFVLLASPESAASEWVNREVAHWCATRGTDGLFIVVTGGELAWDQEAGDFSASSTAVPAALRGRFASEPLHLDLRWARDVADLSLRLSRFRAAVALLASPMRGLPPDELEGEDIRLHRRARRLAKAAVSGLVVLAVAASLAAVAAAANARRAEKEARVALARQVGLEAIDLPASTLDRAFLLSLAAAGLEAGADTSRFRPTRTLIGRYSRLDRIRSTETPAGLTSVRGVALAADGTLAGAVLSFDARGALSSEVLRWPDGAGAPSRTRSPVGVNEVAFLGATSDRMVLRGADGGLSVASGEGTQPIEGRTSAVRADLARAVMTVGESARLVDLGEGRVLADVSLAAPLTSSLHREVTVVAVGDRLVVVDTRSGGIIGDVRLPSPVVAAGATEDGSAVVSLERTGGSALLRLFRRPPGGAMTAASPVAVDLGSDVVRRVVLAPDGARLLVVTDRRTLLLPTSGGASEAVDDGGVGIVASDLSGRYVAVGGSRLAVWDLQTGQRRMALPERVTAMAWGGPCDAGGACVLATVGQSLDVWDPAALTHQRLAGDTNAQALAVSPDGATLSSAGWGPSVAVWQRRPRPDSTSRRELTPAGALTALDPGSRALARVSDGTARISRVGAGPATSIEVGDADRISLLAGGRRLATVAAGAVRLWDTASGRSVPVDPMCSGDLMAASPDGTVLALLQLRDRRLAVCDARSGSKRDVAVLGDLTAPSALAVDDDGGVVVGTEEGELARFPLVAGRIKGGIRIGVGFGGETIRVNALAVARGRVAAGLAPIGQGAVQGRVLVWDVAGNGEPIVFDVDQGEVAAVSLSDDGELLLVAGRDRQDGPVTVQVWESATRRRVGRALDGLSGAVTQLRGHEGEIVGVDLAGRAVRWLLGRDPREEVCEIVGRPLRDEEWVAAASGVLGREDFSAQCGAE